MNYLVAFYNPVWKYIIVDQHMKCPASNFTMCSSPCMCAFLNTKYVTTIFYISVTACLCSKQKTARPRRQFPFTTMRHLSSFLPPYFTHYLDTKLAASARLVVQPPAPRT